MPLTITDFSSLDQTQVAQNATTFQALLQDLMPNADVSRGSVLYALLVRPESELQTLQQANATNLLQVNLGTALSSPDSLDTASMDALFSNYGLKRQTGTTASGSIRIIVHGLTQTLIAASTTFNAGGITYQPVKSFVGVSQAGLVFNDSDRLMTAWGDPSQGLYAFLIDVTATTSGVAGNIAGGTVLSVATTNSQIVQAVAASDFDGGTDAETNQQLIARARQGLTNRTLGDRSSIRAAVLAAYPLTADVSVVGAGDPEMLRAVDPLFGVKTTGKVDVYIRSRATPLSLRVGVQATLIDTSGTWQFSFGRNDYPGFYRVLGVTNPTTAAVGTLPFTVDTGMDTTALGGVDTLPVLTDLTGAFSRYQTGTVRFTDTAISGLSVGATHAYLVDLLYLPQLADISDYFSARARRAPAGDYLFRAAVPCAVTLNLKVIQGIGDTAPDPQAITGAVVAAVNSLDFQTGRLPSSVVIRAVQSLLGPRSRLQLPLDIRGTIYAPSGDNLLVYGPGDLVAPNRPDLLVTPRITYFYLTTAAVSVSVLPPDQTLV